MNSSSGDDEAPKDPRTGGEDFTQQFTENDFEGESGGNFPFETDFFFNCSLNIDKEKNRRKPESNRRPLEELGPRKWQFLELACKTSQVTR